MSKVKCIFAAFTFLHFILFDWCKPSEYLFTFYKNKSHKRSDIVNWLLVWSLEKARCISLHFIYKKNLKWFFMHHKISSLCDSLFCLCAIVQAAPVIHSLGICGFDYPRVRKQGKPANNKGFNCQFYHTWVKFFSGTLRPQITRETCTSIRPWKL